MRVPTRSLVILITLSLSVAGACQQSPSKTPTTGTAVERPSSDTPSPAARHPQGETKPHATERKGDAQAPATLPPASSGERIDKNMPVTISFDKAEVSSVVQCLSNASGIPIISDPDLKGQVTIVCQKDIPLKDAYEVINSALRVRGFTMVGDLDSKVIRVVALKKAVADGVDVYAGKDPSKIVSGNGLVTQVIPLEYASSEKLKDEMKPLVADDQASIVSISSTNTLIVTDNAANIRRIAEIIDNLDKDTSDTLKVEIYQCKCASADSLVDTLSKVFEITKPGQPQQPQQPQPGRPPQGGQPKPQAQAEGGLISLKGEVRLASDPRTNSLIISASEPKLKLVMSVLEKLDVNTQPEVKGKIFPLKYADAKMVADQLNRIFEQPQGSADTSGGGGGRRRYPWDFSRGSDTSQQTTYAGLKRNVVVPDIRTNSVIVTATEQNLQAFEEMIKQLDAPRVLSEITRVFPLKYATAATLADTLNRLFRGEYRRPGSFFEMFMYGNANQNQGGPLDELRNITVVAEEKTNTLLVTGPPQSFTMVEQMINELDRRTVQVFIEVAIVDVTLDDDTKFGVEWQWTSSGKLADGTPKQSVSTDFGTSTITQGLTYRVISDNLKVVLKALETRSNVKVYSTPTITTADNVEAKISIGQDIPFVTSALQTNSGDFQRNVDFKNVAVALTVTPHVNDTSDLIGLDVYQTINEIIGYEPELNAPIVANREAKTSIMVKDSQTIVIGGIIKENKERRSTGIPILSRLPLLGALFRSTEWRKQNSELMVFLTPHILKDDNAVCQVTQETKNKLTYPPKMDPTTITQTNTDQTKTDQTKTDQTKTDQTKTDQTKTAPK